MAVRVLVDRRVTRATWPDYVVTHLSCFRPVHDREPVPSSPFAGDDGQARCRPSSSPCRPACSWRSTASSRATRCRPARSGAPPPACAPPSARAWPARLSRTKFLTNRPDWMSASTRFISTLVSSVMIRGARRDVAIFGGVADRIAHVGDARPRTAGRRSASSRAGTRNRPSRGRSRPRPASRTPPGSGG